MADSSAPRFQAAGMDECPTMDDWLTAPESERLGRMRFRKRRDESRLARWNAKRTIAATLGVEGDLRRVVISNAADGAPEVSVDGAPADVAISMTDRSDWAVCTVWPGARPIGCDLEVVEPRSAAFVRDWFTERERAVVADAAGDDHDLLANLCWSAKESALKVLRTGLRRDTRSVEVSFASVDRIGSASSAGWHEMTVRDLAESTVFTGWWHRFGAGRDFVLTYVSTDPGPPPHPVTEPSPLEAATPSHRWLDGDPRH